MLYIAFVCIFLSIFLFTYNKNHLSKKNKMHHIRMADKYIKIIKRIRWFLFLNPKFGCHHIELY